MIFVIDAIIFVLNILWYVIFAQVILSWLTAFNVINTSNEHVRRALQALDRLTEPLYRPLRKVLPDFGGLDFSPLILLLIDGFLVVELHKLAAQVPSSA